MDGTNLFLRDINESRCSSGLTLLFLPESRISRHNILVIVQILALSIELASLIESINEECTDGKEEEQAEDNDEQNGVIGEIAVDGMFIEKGLRRLLKGDADHAAGGSSAGLGSSDHAAGGSSAG